MKIVVLEQDNCGWCTRLHPHITKLAGDDEIPLEFINIGDNWDDYKHLQIRSTPTVLIYDNEVLLRKFIIQKNGIPELISGVKEFIK